MEKQRLRNKEEGDEQETVRIRDEAVRRALNTPPKPYKESKVGKGKPKTSPASGKR